MLQATPARLAGSQKEILYLRLEKDINAEHETPI